MNGGGEGLTMKILSAGSTLYGARAAVGSLLPRARIEIATDHGHLIHEAALHGKSDGDILIIPEDMIEDLEKRGLLADGSRRRFGFTGIGYAVKSGQPVPAMTDGEALARAVNGAGQLYLTSAPTGVHMRAWLAGVGLSAALNGKLRTFERATEMLAALAGGDGNTLAFGPTTELMAWRAKGTDYGGSVPPQFDLPLMYAGGVLKRSAEIPGAIRVLDEISGPGGIQHFRQSGVL